MPNTRSDMPKNIHNELMPFVRELRQLSGVKSITAIHFISNPDHSHATGKLIIKSSSLGGLNIDVFCSKGIQRLQVLTIRSLHGQVHDFLKLRSI